MCPNGIQEDASVNFQAVYSLRKQESSGADGEECVAPTFKCAHHEFEDAKKNKMRSQKVDGQEVTDPIAKRSFGILNDVHMIIYDYRQSHSSFVHTPSLSCLHTPQAGRDAA